MNILRTYQVEFCHAKARRASRRFTGPPPSARRSYRLPATPIIKAFSLAHADEGQREQLLEAISGRGAFRFSRALVHRWGIQQQWYDYRDREIERIVADWLDAQEIPYEK